ncbi:hypothetical protein RAC89_15060 [Paenibacillus sp. GD4]|jgi:hypothetical protein|uniref:hypothetical protein n=1 Tax=Paenibacillus TaxID=44249 RepID=UPI002542CC97|nr:MULTISPECIES: hypothetical protein [Paenibacillus]MDQ1911721.1 hypothetical protein [Paenibacillus sp. GD4]
MTKKNQLLLAGSIVLFIGLLLLAVYFESQHFIYAASALPILIVLLLPDWRRDQYVTAAKSSRFELHRQSAGEDSLLTITFKPGAVRWSSRRLFIRFEEAVNAEMSHQAVPATSIAVLPYDLLPHPSKAGWIGIELGQLVERTRGLSYTTDEVTRLTIRMNELEIAALDMVSSSSAAAKTGSKSVQA